MRAGQGEEGRGRSRREEMAARRRWAASTALVTTSSGARVARLRAARGRRKGGENGHGSGRGDKDGCASATGEVRRRPTRGDADVEIGGELSENRGGTVIEFE